MKALLTPQTIVLLNMALCAVAAVAFASARQWGWALYWGCAFGLTYAATVLIGKH